MALSAATWPYWLAGPSIDHRRAVDRAVLVQAEADGDRHLARVGPAGRDDPALLDLRAERVELVLRHLGVGAAGGDAEGRRRRPTAPGGAGVGRGRAAPRSVGRTRSLGLGRRRQRRRRVGGAHAAAARTCGGSAAAAAAGAAAATARAAARSAAVVRERRRLGRGRRRRRLRRLRGLGRRRRLGGGGGGGGGGVGSSSPGVSAASAAAPRRPSSAGSFGDGVSASSPRLLAEVEVGQLGRARRDSTGSVSMWLASSGEASEARSGPRRGAARWTDDRDDEPGTHGGSAARLLQRDEADVLEAGAVDRAHHLHDRRRSSRPCRRAHRCARRGRSWRPR